MRGVAAYAGDFYYGASAVTTGSVDSDTTGEGSGPAPATAGSAPTLNTVPTASTPALGVVDLAPLLNINPLWALGAFVALLIGLKLLREWGHKSSEFQPLKLDLWWFVSTVVACLAGVPLAKAILNKYRFQPVTDWVNNA